MSKKENVKKIKKYIDEVLNTKSSLIAKRPVKQDKLKKLFCTLLTEIQFVNARAVGMKHDFNIDFTEYDLDIDRVIIDSSEGVSDEQYIVFANYEYNV